MKQVFFEKEDIDKNCFVKNKYGSKIFSMNSGVCNIKDMPVVQTTEEKNSDNIMGTNIDSYFNPNTDISKIEPVNYSNSKGVLVESTVFKNLDNDRRSSLNPLYESQNIFQDAADKENYDRPFSSQIKMRQSDQIGK